MKIVEFECETRARLQIVSQYIYRFIFHQEDLIQTIMRLKFHPPNPAHIAR